MSPLLDLDKFSYSLERVNVDIIGKIAGRKLPDFIIVGAQKGGTTSLYLYLLQHPQVVGATEKEIHFFDNQFEQGVEWYQKQFPTRLRINIQSLIVGEKTITGESSPYYLFHPHAPRRIAEVIPDVKLIFLLRDPIERAYSHYHHMIRIGTEYLDFDEALEAEEDRLKGERAKIMRDKSYQSYEHQHHSYLARGDYIAQLEAYQEHFSMRQMLVLKSNHLFTETQKSFNKVTQFLGLRSWDLQGHSPSNTGSYPPISPSVRKRMEAYFSDKNKQLHNYVGFDFS